MAEILVAGGTGFIGAHLVQKLSSEGDFVVVVGYQKKKPQNVSNVEFLNFDLRDLSATRKYLSGRSFKKVFNLSGYIDHTPFFKGGRTVLDQHFLALQNLVEVINRTQLQAFVQFGSSDEYGNAPSPQKEDIREAPIAPYSMGKVAASHFVQMLSRTENFPGVVLRLFLVYGPGQDDRRFIPQIIRGCLDKKEFKSSEGGQLRDLCYIDDIVDGIIRASETKEAIGELINLASGQAVTIRKVIDEIVSLCQGGKPQFGTVPYRLGENMSLYADISKAERLLKWSPRISLKQGLEKTIESFQSAVPSRAV